MMKSKKLMAWSLATAMVFAALTACGGSGSSSTETTAAAAETTAAAETKAAETEAAETEAAETEAAAGSGSVYYLNFKPEADQAWQDLAAAYTAETGVDVKVVTAASGTYSDTLTAEMAKLPQSTTSAIRRA